MFPLYEYAKYVFFCTSASFHHHDFFFGEWFCVYEFVFVFVWKFSFYPHGSIFYDELISFSCHFVHVFVYDYDYNSVWYFVCDKSVCECVFGVCFSIFGWYFVCDKSVCECVFGVCFSIFVWYFVYDDFVFF